MGWRINERNHPVSGTWFELQYNYPSIDLNGKTYMQWATEKDYSTLNNAQKALAKMAAQ